MEYPGGDPGVRTPPSGSTSLINSSMYDSLHDAAQIAPAPSEKTKTSAASSCYALEVDRMSEQSAGLRYVCTMTILTLETTPTHDLRMRRNYKYVPNTPLSLILDGIVEKAQETSSDSDMHNTVCLCHCCNS